MVSMGSSWLGDRGLSPTAAATGFFRLNLLLKMLDEIARMEKSADVAVTGEKLAGTSNCGVQIWNGKFIPMSFFCDLFDLSIV